MGGDEMSGGGVDPPLLFSRTMEQERILFFLLVPSYVFGLFGNVATVSAIIFTPALHKPRHVFQALSLVNSVVGLFLGVYGVLFLLYRTPFFPSYTSSSSCLYLFLFHRYFLLLGDLLPSLDRCFAIACPLRYLTHATANRALVVCLATAVAAAVFTLVAYSLSVVPSDFGASQLRPFQLLYLLTTERFGIALSVPYLVLLVAVSTCDLRSLLIAVRRRRELDREMAGGVSVVSTGEDNREKLRKMTSSSSSSSSSDSPQSSCSRQVSKMSAELRISLRCLATTSWFFLSQMCTFLPAVVLFGCGGEAGEMSGRRDGCSSILSPWIRAFIFAFYQFQFFKPVFYCAMDADLAKGVRRRWFGAATTRTNIVQKPTNGEQEEDDPNLV